MLPFLKISKARSITVLQKAKSSLATPLFHVAVLVQVQIALLPTLLPGKAPGKPVENGPIIWISAATLEIWMEFQAFNFSLDSPGCYDQFEN